MLSQCRALTDTLNPTCHALTDTPGCMLPLTIVMHARYEPAHGTQAFSCIMLEHPLRTMSTAANLKPKQLVAHLDSFLRNHLAAHQLMHCAALLLQASSAAHLKVNTSERDRMAFCIDHVVRELIVSMLVMKASAARFCCVSRVGVIQVL